MYTLIDLDQIQYQKGIRKDDYKYIADLNNFLEDLALGIENEDKVLLSKEDTRATSELSDLLGQEFLVYIEDLPDSITITNEITKETKISDVNDTSSESVEDIKEKEDDEHMIAEVSQERHTRLFNKSTKNTDEQEKLTRVTNKEETEKKEIEVETKNEIKHKGILSIFSRKKKEKQEAEINTNFDSLARQLVKDYSRGAMFKQYIIDNKLLNSDEVKYVEDKIEENQRCGTRKYFIQICREEHMFVRNHLAMAKPSDRISLINENEDICARLLTFSLSKEILSKTVIKSNIHRIKELNKNLSKQVTSYFIYDLDNEKHIVTVCKDYSSPESYYQLEKLYPGYTINVYLVIEGVTREIISEMGAM